MKRRWRAIAGLPRRAFVAGLRRGCVAGLSRGLCGGASWRGVEGLFAAGLRRGCMALSQRAFVAALRRGGGSPQPERPRGFSSGLRRDSAPCSHGKLAGVLSFHVKQCRSRHRHPIGGVSPDVQGVRELGRPFDVRRSARHESKRSARLAPRRELTRTGPPLSSPIGFTQQRASAGHEDSETDTHAPRRLKCGG